MMRDLHDCINKIKEEVDEIPLDDRPRVLVALPQPGAASRPFGMLMKGPHIARQIGMRMSMVLGCDILMQEFSRRARLKVGIIFRRSRL